LNPRYPGNRGKLSFAEAQEACLSAIQTKLNLDAHLNGAVTREEYLGRKEKLLREKAAVTDRLAEIRRNGNHWPENRSKPSSTRLTKPKSWPPATISNRSRISSETDRLGPQVFELRLALCLRKSVGHFGPAAAIAEFLQKSALHAGEVARVLTEGALTDRAALMHRCPGCDGERCAALTSKRGWAYHRCADCGQMFVDDGGRPGRRWEPKEERTETAHRTGKTRRRSEARTRPQET
jgi:hypothetical protein